MKRIMYIEDKSAGLDGHGRIGWVRMSRAARSYWTEIRSRPECTHLTQAW